VLAVMASQRVHAKRGPTPASPAQSQKAHRRFEEAAASI
jgi:hypothetical protein